MSAMARNIVEMVDFLPEEEQSLAYELVKRLVLAWDSDYTKLTPSERKRLEQAEVNFVNGLTVGDDEIDWES